MLAGCMCMGTAAPSSAVVPIGCRALLMVVVVLVEMVLVLMAAMIMPVLVM